MMAGVVVVVVWDEFWEQWWREVDIDVGIGAETLMSKT